MPTLMITEIPGADTTLAEGMRQSGVLDALQSAPGFHGHWAGAAGSGYRVTELWDSPEDCQAFFERHIAPTYPPGAELPRLDFFELYLEIKPAT